MNASPSANRRQLIGAKRIVRGGVGWITPCAGIVQSNISVHT